LVKKILGEILQDFLNRDSVATVGTVEQKKLKFFAPLWLRCAEPVDNPPCPLLKLDEEEAHQKETHTYPLLSCESLTKEKQCDSPS